MYDIILLPLHRWIDSEWGSESEWALNMAKALAISHVDFMAIIGQADLGTQKKFLEWGIDYMSMGIGMNMTLFGDIGFYSKLYLSYAKLRKKAKIIHHVFPLGFRTGFNPSLLLRNRVPAVVGPLLYAPPVARRKMTTDSIFRKTQGNYMGKPVTRSTMFYPDWIFSALNKRTLENADFLIFDSQQTREIYSNEMPQLENKDYAIIAGIVDESEFKPASFSHNFSSSMRFGIISYLRPDKHIDTVIKAFSKIKDSGAVLLIAGDGEIVPSLRLMTRENGIEQMVKFLGRLSRPETVKFMSNLDVIISLSEVPWSVTASILEGMMSGLPIISYEPDIIQPREISCGFLVNFDDIDGLAGVFERIISDPNILIKKGTEARKFAEENVSMKETGSKLKKIYNKLC